MTLRADPLPPRSRIGILGGGQLGRMLAIAAAEFGFSTIVFAPEADSPAFEVSAERICAPYSDPEALARFADAIDVATFEFENLPRAALETLEARVAVRPGVKALALTQDRLIEKRFLRDLDVMTAPFHPASTRTEFEAGVRELGLPALLKTRRLGYDGRGQFLIRSPDEAERAFASLRVSADHSVPAILEGLVSFACEVSVIAARGLGGAFSAFDVTENRHESGILRISRVPARICGRVAREAIEIARRIAVGLDVVGVFAVEFFVVGEGEDAHLIVNEIAPRVHNSGHWTAYGAATSQFAQHIRAIAGWPFGATTQVFACEMTNLIGEDALDWQRLAAEPDARLTLYGKNALRAGRKMGHITRRIGEEA